MSQRNGRPRLPHLPPTTLRTLRALPPLCVKLRTEETALALGPLAGLWSGAAASFEDLSLGLTGSWGATSATSIWSDGIDLYIAGYGFNNTTGQYEALMWTRVIPAPGSLALLGLGGLVAARRRRMA